MRLEHDITCSVIDNNHIILIFYQRKCAHNGRNIACDRFIFLLKLVAFDQVGLFRDYGRK